MSPLNIFLSTLAHPASCDLNTPAPHISHTKPLINQVSSVVQKLMLTFNSDLQITKTPEILPTANTARPGIKSHIYMFAGAHGHPSNTCATNSHHISADLFFDLLSSAGPTH